MPVAREDYVTAQQLSLAERASIESKSWDQWALKQEVRPLQGGGLTPGINITSEQQSMFPHPPELWIARYPTARRASWVWEYEHLMPLADAHVLEVGGTGESLLRFILAGAASGVGIDPSEESLQLGRQRVKLYGPAIAGRITFKRAIAEELPFEDATFDRVYANAVIHHTIPQLAAKEIYRVLKPGGKASFHDPLEGYALARWARQRLPYPGKGEEGVDYPLTYDVIQRFLDTFDRGEYRESELFGVPQQLLSRIYPKAGRWLARHTYSLDDGLVQHIPQLKRYCKAVAMRVTKAGSTGASTAATL
jgi:ubiquinone/menaquinone biosynthesis C-methylase UbiE